MDVLVRDIADVWLSLHGFATSEANRIGYALWAGAAGDVEHQGDEPDAHMWAALGEMRFSRRLDEPDDAGETVVPVAELDALRAAFVRGNNPFDHRKALHNVGLLTDIEDIDGDYPAVGLDEVVHVDDDEAAVLGLTPRDELPGPSGGAPVESLDAGDAAKVDAGPPADTAGEVPFGDQPDAFLAWEDESGTGVLWFVNPKTSTYAAVPVTTGDSRDEDDGNGGRRVVWHVDIAEDGATATTSPSVHVPGEFHTANPQTWQLVESLPSLPMNERVSDTTNGMGDATAAGDGDATTIAGEDVAARPDGGRPFDAPPQ